VSATTLADGELHVWIADLDAPRPAGEQAYRQNLLSADERERSARFMSQRDGARWARSRGLLRLLLGGYLSVSPAELCFQLGEHGKPELTCVPTSTSRATPGRAKLHFNLSHSQGIGLYVFALDGAVGCDVETLGREIDVLAVAKRALGNAVAEQLRLLGSQHREREFLRAWVRHEARLKCWGIGLGAAAATGVHDRDCRTIDVDVGELATAAVAAEQTPAKVECWRLHR